MNNSFCVLPWVSVATDTTGDVVPCCVFKQKIQKLDGTNYNLGFDNLNEIYNSEDFVKIRKAMIAGELVPGCQECYDSEKYGGISLRTQLNSLFTVDNPQEIAEIKPKYLDVRPGNTCNLRCRSCSPASSSQFAKEIKSLQSYGIGEFHPEYPLLDDTWYNTPQFHTSMKLLLETVESIYLTGGEPSVIQTNIDTLNKLVAEGRSKEISISISTNLTNSSFKFFDLLKNFKSVTIYASIDGYDSMQEYLRHPSNWNSIVSNLNYLLKLDDNVQVVVVPVIQITNLNKITELFEFIEQLNHTNSKKITIFPVNLETPDYLNILYLPKSYKEQCYNKIKAWIETSNQSYLNDYTMFIKNKADVEVEYKDILDRFVRYNRILDENRNVSLENVNSELVELLKEEHIWK